MPRVNITTIFDDDDNEIELPTKWAICGTCRGNGKHSLRMGALTQDDIDEMGPDSFEDYMAGHYDAVCEDCEDGKVRVVDQDYLTPEQRTAWEAAVRDEEDYQAEVRAERRYLYGMDAY